MIVRYLDPLERLEFEVIQRREEGQNVASLNDAFESLRGLPRDDAGAAAHALLRDLMQQDAHSPGITTSEPSDLDAIRKTQGNYRGVARPPHSFSDKELLDRVLGGWLGRAAGCLLGKPIERYSRAVIRELLEANGNWPLNDYWTQEGMPHDLLERYPWKRRLGFESLRENIECMPEDDDLNYTMLNLHVLENYGFDFDSVDICTEWVTRIPAFQVFTSDRVAYLNILRGLDPPETATYMNPFREWIGAQIRADLWGYVSPGNPLQAAELAWRDARVSHTRNGIYGEMFFAAMISNAFVLSGIRELVEASLAFVPARSRFAQAITSVLDMPVATMSWEQIVDRLYEQFGAYHWVHTINNAALAVAALLKGDGDYERTICNVVMGGWDTDSNGATVGSVIGVLRGAGALPPKWTRPLDDRIRSSMGSFDNARLSDLAGRTVTAMRKSAPGTPERTAIPTDDF